MASKISYTQDGSGAFCSARVMDDLLLRVALAEEQVKAVKQLLIDCEADVEVAWLTTGQVREVLETITDEPPAALSLAATDRGAG